MITWLLILLLILPVTRRIVVAVLSAAISLVALVFVIATGAERRR